MRTSNDILDQLKTPGTYSLIQQALRGDFTLPAAILDGYAELEKHLDEHTDHRGEFESNTADKEAQRMCDALMRVPAWGGANSILTEHLQPALEDLIAHFKDDMAACGKFIHQPSPSVDMLNAPEDVRLGYLHASNAQTQYGSLRAAWQTLRRWDSHHCHDPLGVRSPLAEVANLPDLFADWELASNGRTPWPWTSNAFHVRLAWLLDNDAQVWLPTTQEHNTAWSRYNPQAKVAA
jgi:hypothetical protein